MQLSSNVQHMGRWLGFGLIEVLVAIVIFSAGVLGIASMQLNGLGMLSNSNSLNTAVLAAADMADRMRANELGLNDGNYDAITGTESTPTCEGTCTPAQIAARDAAEIMAQLNSTLSSAGLSVSALNGGLFTIEVRWAEKSSTDWGFANAVTGDATQAHRFTFMPLAPN